MEKIDLISNWVNWSQVDYDIFVCFNYDLRNGFIIERFQNIKINDLNYPIIKKALTDFYTKFNSEQVFFLENEEQASVTNMEEYWNIYAQGFDEGFHLFEKKIQRESTVYSNEDYLKQILYTRLYEPFDFSFLSFIYKENKKILDYNSFYKVGKETGEIYYCWSFIIRARILFIDVIKNLYSNLIPYFEHHHTYNDIRNIKEYPLASEDKNLSFRDMIKPQYLVDNKYENFISRLKESHIELDKPILNENGEWNYDAVQCLNIYFILCDLKIINEYDENYKKINKSFHKKIIANTFNVKFTSIKNKGKSDIGKSNNSLIVAQKIEFYAKKVFFK